MYNWKELWLYYIDEDLEDAKLAITELSSLKCHQHPTIKLAIKQERQKVRDCFSKKKDVIRRYKAWERKQHTGKND